MGQIDTDLMTDLETMGTQEDAAVLSIGVLAFKPGAFIDDPSMSIQEGKQVRSTEFEHFFETEISLFDNIALGRTIDPGTAKWWSKQKDRSLLTRSLESKTSVRTAVIKLLAFLESVQYEHVWAKSPSFDLDILRSLAKSVGFDLPIDFRKERDVRTTTSPYPLLEPYKIAKSMTVTHNGKVLASHDALYDCIIQAQAVQEVEFLRAYHEVQAHKFLMLESTVYDATLAPCEIGLTLQDCVRVFGEDNAEEQYRQHLKELEEKGLQLQEIKEWPLAFIGQRLTQEQRDLLVNELNAMKSKQLGNEVEYELVSKNGRTDTEIETEKQRFLAACLENGAIDKVEPNLATFEVVAACDTETPVQQHELRVETDVIVQARTGLGLSQQECDSLLNVLFEDNEQGAVQEISPEKKAVSSACQDLYLCGNPTTLDKKLIEEEHVHELFMQAAFDPIGTVVSTLSSSAFTESSTSGEADGEKN